MRLLSSESGVTNEHVHCIGSVELTSLTLLSLKDAVLFTVTCMCTRLKVDDSRMNYCFTHCIKSHKSLWQQLRRVIGSGKAVSGHIPQMGYQAISMSLSHIPTLSFPPSILPNCKTRRRCRSPLFRSFSLSLIIPIHHRDDRANSLRYTTRPV